LSAQAIPEQLLEAVDPESLPKPCDYFYKIGGASTGGSATVVYEDVGRAGSSVGPIAIMPGRRRMSIDECINAYASLADLVF
jgi:hypothetical protein